MRAHSSRVRSHVLSSKERRALPPRIAVCPPTPSHLRGGNVFDKYRGFRRTLRYLTIGTVVVRLAVDGPHPVQLRPIC